jgi:hypothetical protein
MLLAESLVHHLDPFVFEISQGIGPRWYGVSYAMGFLVAWLVLRWLARTGRTPAGVNGLFDMGGNAGEWVDDPPAASANTERRTRGGSWWYGTAQMQAEHHQAKPADTAVVYIGFRCARSR